MYIHRPRAPVRLYDGEKGGGILENSKIMFSFSLRNSIIDIGNAIILLFSIKYQK